MRTLRRMVLVCPSADYLSHLKSGLVPQTDSWELENLRLDGTRELACCGDTSEFEEEMLAFVGHRDQTASGSDSLEAYAASLLAEAAGLCRGVGCSLRESTFVLNLFCYWVPKTVAEKIVEGIRAFADSKGDEGALNIVLLVRNRRSFLEADAYKALLQKWPSASVSFVEYGGSRYNATGSKSSPIPRGAFLRALSVERAEFYSRLVFRSNAYLGHFKLANSHVRTHYDLEDFVREDIVYEQILAQLTELVPRDGTLAVVRHGLEVNALEQLATKLRADLGSRVIQSVHYAAPLPDWAASDIASADSVLLLTDVVNSGHSLEAAYLDLYEIRGRKGPVRCYSIAQMSNTPALPFDLMCGTKIRRPFYEPGDCVLCRLEQPATDVSSLIDFRTVHPTQLTPLDFWEMVYDCHAMERRQVGPSGSLLPFRVETGLLVTRYGKWLRNVVAAKCSTADFGGQPPSSILTVEEEPPSRSSGRAFAEIVKRALRIERAGIRSVARSELRSESLNRPIAENELGRERVLMVDDGINGGETMRGLALYAFNRGATLAGAVVIDNRLEKHELDRLRRSAKIDGEIVTLYDWPSEVSQQVCTIPNAH